MGDFLRAVAFGAIGLAILVTFLLLTDRNFELLPAVVFGGIGAAISVAIDLGKRRGAREAEFGSSSRENQDG